MAESNNHNPTEFTNIIKPRMINSYAHAMLVLYTVHMHVLYTVHMHALDTVLEKLHIYKS